MPKITFLPSGETLEAPLNSPLLDVCEENNSPILFGCAAGACGSCRIRVIENIQHLSAITEEEFSFLSTLTCDPRERLACQCSLEGDVTIEIVN